jgi:hypothetical protein
MSTWAAKLEQAEWDPSINTGLQEVEDTLMLIQDARKARMVPRDFTPAQRYDTVIDLAFHNSFDMHTRLLSMVSAS